MNHPNVTTLWNVLRKKLALMLVLAVTAAAAFATLGDGKIKSSKSSKSLLSAKTAVAKSSFSLKSGYSYRGNRILTTTTQTRQEININTAITYQKGHTTYTVPLKKKVLDNKVTFNPNAATRN